jgi:hypothetical protein
MLLLILIIVIGLVAWALRLMERAIQGQEFSLMLAGFLVASSAAAMMVVYFLMSNYMLFMTSSPQMSGLDPQQFDRAGSAEMLNQIAEYSNWVVRADASLGR